MLVRRTVAAVGVSLAPALAATGPLPVADAAPKGAALDDMERAVVKRINRVRARHGVRRVRASPALSAAADFHSREILNHDHFSHSSPDGTSMFRRVRRYKKANAYGETIGHVPARARAQATKIVNAWMRSPGHRGILLSRSYKRVGVGRRTGELHGRRRSVITANFTS
jgi:uncharacterized protein YkwD